MIEPWNIAAGELRQRVNIQAASANTTDTFGHPIETWADSITNVAAKIETPTGRKLELARQLVPTATHVITVRYRELDDELNRIAYGERVFNIGHQNDVDERHVKLILTCTEEFGPNADQSGD